MSRMIAVFLLAGAAVASTQVLADDASSGQTIDTKQWMADCMARMKTANNGMSAADMKKSCRDQLKQHVDHPDQKADPVVPGH